MSSHYGLTLERALNSPPLVIAFRGHALRDVMRKHRISQTDLNSALRREQIWNIRQVEAVIIEPTGTFSIYRIAAKPDEFEAEVLLDVPGYRKLVEHFDMDGKSTEDKVREGKGGKGGKAGEVKHEESRSRSGSSTRGGDEEEAIEDYRAVKGGLPSRGRGVSEPEVALDRDAELGSRRDPGKKSDAEEGGQGGEGATVGEEREANEIAQSAA